MERTEQNIRRKSCVAWQQEGNRQAVSEFRRTVSMKTETEDRKGGNNAMRPERQKTFLTMTSHSIFKAYDRQWGGREG